MLTNSRTSRLTRSSRAVRLFRDRNGDKNHAVDLSRDVRPILDYLRDRVGSNLVAGGIEILDLAVVGPFVGHVEGGRDGTAIGILSSLLEQVGVQTLVQIVHRVVERQENDLRYLLRQVVTCFRFQDRVSECRMGDGKRKSVWTCTCREIACFFAGKCDFFFLCMYMCTSVMGMREREREREKEREELVPRVISTQRRCCMRLVKPRLCDVLLSDSAIPGPSGSPISYSRYAVSPSAYDNFHRPFRRGILHDRAIAACDFSEQAARAGRARATMRKSADARTRRRVESDQSGWKRREKCRFKETQLENSSRDARARAFPIERPRETLNPGRRSSRRQATVEIRRGTSTNECSQEMMTRACILVKVAR